MQNYDPISTLLTPLGQEDSSGLLLSLALGQEESSLQLGLLWLVSGRVLTMIWPLPSNILLHSNGSGWVPSHCRTSYAND